MFGEKKPKFGSAPEDEEREEQFKNFLIGLVAVVFAAGILLGFFLVRSYLSDRSRDAVLKTERFLSRTIEIALSQEQGSSTAVLRVHELHTAMAAGTMIKHGVRRYLPAAVVRPDNALAEIKVSIDSVTVDGSPITVSPKINGATYQVDMGSFDRMLSKGTHEFDIQYEVPAVPITGRQGYSELIWPLTETGWIVTDILDAKIVLPGFVKARDVRAECWLTDDPKLVLRLEGGVQCEVQEYGRVLDASGVAVTVKSTRPIQPGEAPVVSLKW